MPHIDCWFRFLYGQWQQRKTKSLSVRKECSDSSMGNGNKNAARPHMTGCPCSDSSMGNGNGAGRRLLGFWGIVQIPLWAMATQQLQPMDVCLAQFRFLYGQWQQDCSGKPCRCHEVQIPLWAMATCL